MWRSTDSTPTPDEADLWPGARAAVRTSPTGGWLARGGAAVPQRSCAFGLRRVLHYRSSYFGGKKACALRGRRDAVRLASSPPGVCGFKRLSTQAQPEVMSDDEGRLLIDDLQDGTGQLDNVLQANALVDVKSTQVKPICEVSLQGESESTSINKLSTPLTVPVFGQPQATLSGEAIFHGGAASNSQRAEGPAFSFTSTMARTHCEQDPMFSSATSLRHKSKGRNDTSSSRKRKDSLFDGQNPPSSPVDSDDAAVKRHKPLCDRGTCVQSRAVQSEMDGSFFDLEVGSTRIVEMTVVCKMESNELYVVAKWKDQELSGILTDGHPPAYTLYMKKRSTVANSGSSSSNGSACGDSNDRATNSGASTPSKSRQVPLTPRESKKRTSTESKRKSSCSTARPGSSADPPEEEEELEDETTPGVSASTMDALRLVEVPGRKSMHVCSVDGCQHRYVRSEEIEYHKATAHAKRAVMYETRCSQTDISAFRRTSVQTDVDGLFDSEVLCPKTDSEEISVKLENLPSSSSTVNTKIENAQASKSPAGYSDISDDGVAPQLQKLFQVIVVAERNRGAMNGTGVSPVVSSVGTPTPVSAISGSVRVPVNPVPAGMYMSSFAHQMMAPYASPLTATPTSNPAPSPQQLSKISQSHMKTPDEVAAANNVLSAQKTMQSSAAQNIQRQFGLQMMQSGTGQHQAAMMQAAAAQAQMAQMHHLYMQQMAAGARGGQFPMAATSAGPHEMALAALQGREPNVTDIKRYYCNTFVHDR
uniref:C2H2-type domain-containing protein n=1 Tax=Angiostrongylus cantonensis TaxID=6313 RepID=A0A0K0DHK7_ANGCA